LADITTDSFTQASRSLADPMSSYLPGHHSVGMMVGFCTSSALGPVHRSRGSEELRRLGRLCGTDHRLSDMACL
jgi:hypothetical protein